MEKNMREKQKLVGRNTCTPMDAPQVRSSVTLSLNREETLSEQSLKTPSNNPDVDLPLTVGNNGKSDRQNLSKDRVSVFVLGMSGNPLMPTTPVKARILLKNNKAKVVQRTPFTIQLKYDSEKTTQPITLGIDPGYRHIGFSAITKHKELISGEAVIRTDIPKLNEEKAMYRRNRRNKLWYRQPRWANRGNNTEGWFAPSIKHKLNTHIKLIQKVERILPVTNTVLEIAAFDMHKMRNPEISGIEYQQGELQGYEIREYLLEKFNRTCVYCGKKNIPLEIEHLTPKSKGGANTVDNLAIACHSCNQKKNNRSAEEFGHPEVRKKALKPLKDATFMNSVKWKIANILDTETTYGYITKKNRISLGIGKSHANDAFVIAGGTDQIRTLPFTITQRRRNNRSIQTNRKGFRPSIRRKRYTFQPGDMVLHDHERFSVVGVHNYGKSIVIKGGEKKMDINTKKVKLVKYGKGLRFTAQFLPPMKKVGILGGS